MKKHQKKSEVIEIDSREPSPDNESKACGKTTKSKTKLTPNDQNKASNKNIDPYASTQKDKPDATKTSSAESSKAAKGHGPQPKNRRSVRRSSCVIYELEVLSEDELEQQGKRKRKKDADPDIVELR